MSNFSALYLNVCAVFLLIRVAWRFKVVNLNLRFFIPQSDTLHTIHPRTKASSYGWKRHVTDWSLLGNVQVIGCSQRADQRSRDAHAATKNSQGARTSWKLPL